MEQDNVVRLIELMKWSAEFHYDYHKVVQAQKTLHKVRRIQIVYYDVDSPEILDTELEIFACACLLASESRAKTSAAYKALIRKLKVVGRPFKPTASCLYGILGKALYVLGMEKETLEVLKAAVDLRSEVFGNEAYFTVLARFDYLIRRSAIDPGSCTEEMEQLYHHLDSILPVNHSYLCDLRRELAVDLRNIGLKPQAVDLYKKRVMEGFPEYNEDQVDWKAHIFLAGSLLMRELEKDAAEVYKEAYTISCKAFGQSHELTQCSAFTASGMFFKIGSPEVAKAMLQQCYLPLSALKETFDGIFLAEVDPTSSSEQKRDTSDASNGTSKGAVGSKLPDPKIPADNSHREETTVQTKFECAVRLLRDFKYDEGFRNLMSTYLLQSEIRGHGDALSIKILETICSWELCNEFVSQAVIVEALQFLEKLLPALRKTLPAESVTLQLVEWRHLDLIYRSDSSKGEQVANVAMKTFEKLSAAINLSPDGTNNVSTIFWEHAHLMQKITKVECVRRMTQDLISQVESGISPREHMRYQELLGRSAVSTGNLREGLKELLKLYKTECKTLKLNDPLLLSLLEGIHFSYTNFPGGSGNDKHVGFFRKAYDTFKTSLGAESSSTIVVQVLLASAISMCPQLESKMLKEGEDLAQDAISKAVRVFGHIHWNTVKAKKSLVHFLVKRVPGIAKKDTQNRLNRATVLMEETVKIQAEIFGPEHPFYLDACKEFCAMCIQFGRGTAAQKYAEIAVRVYTRKFGRHSPQAAEADNYLALIQRMG